jgi:hypothetical protein
VLIITGYRSTAFIPSKRDSPHLSLGALAQYPGRADEQVGTKC